MKDKNNTTTEYINKCTDKNEDDFENKEEIFKTKIALLVLCLLLISVISCVILIHYFRIKLNIQ